MTKAKTGEWISKGWDIVVKGPNLWMFVLLALIYSVVMSVIGSTGIGAIIFAGPAMGAIYAVTMHCMKTGKIDLNRLQDGFQPFVQLMVAGILVGVFCAAGFIFCIVPGIILSAMYTFPILLILDRKLEFWDAMEVSRKRVQEDLGGFVIFTLAILGLNLLGALVCYVGILVTAPVTWCAVVVAYRELWPEEQTVIIPPTEESPAA